MIPFRISLVSMGNLRRFGRDSSDLSQNRKFCCVAYVVVHMTKLDKTIKSICDKNCSKVSCNSFNQIPGDSVTIKCKTFKSFTEFFRP